MRGKRSLSNICLVGLLLAIATPAVIVQADEKGTPGFTQLPPLSAEKIAAAAAAPDVMLGRKLMTEAKNDAETLSAFNRAAKQDNPVGEAYLGYLYYMGHGTRQDDETAAMWYQRAAEQGFIDAQLRLGLMYAIGRDLSDPVRNLPRDNKQALHWLAQAAYQGSWLAAEQMASIYVQAGLHNGHMDAARQFTEVLASKNDPYAIQLMCLSYGWGEDNSREKQHWCDLRDHLPAYETDVFVAYRQLESADIPMPSNRY